MSRRVDFRPEARPEGGSSGRIFHLAEFLFDIPAGQVRSGSGF